jgi:hypothetical protein
MFEADPCPSVTKPAPKTGISEDGKTLARPVLPGRHATAFAMTDDSITQALVNDTEGR